MSCSTPSALGRLQRLSRTEGTTRSSTTAAVLTGNGIRRRDGPGAEGNCGGSLSWGHRSGTLRPWIEGKRRDNGIGRRRAATALGNGTVAAAQERTEGLPRRRRSRHSTVER